MARGVRRVGPHFDDLGSIPLSIVRPEDVELCVQDILCEIALREKAENVLRLPLRLVIWEQQQHAVSLTVCLLTTIHVKHMGFHEMFAWHTVLRLSASTSSRLSGICRSQDTPHRKVSASAALRIAGREMRFLELVHMFRADPCTCIPRSENAATIMTKPSLQEDLFKHTGGVGKLLSVELQSQSIFPNLWDACSLQMQP